MSGRIPPAERGWRGSVAIVRTASLLVPRDRRREWLEEWLAELAALDTAHRAGMSGLPGAVEFAMGSLPHAVWARTEGWTLDSVLQDVRFATRVLRRAPGFTIVAALTLALGIGANASIFSLVNGLVLRAPSSVQEPDRLVQIARSYESAPRWDAFSWPALEVIAQEGRAFSGVAAYSGQVFVLGRGLETERVVGQLVTGSYFDVLGVTPAAGRLLQPMDDVEPGARPVIVLSHALWVRRYGGDPSVVGRTIDVGGAPYEVLGVAPEDFTGVENIGPRPEAFVPTMMYGGYGGDLPFDAWEWSWLNVVGRLADGTTFEEARAAMDVVSTRLREADADNEDMLVVLAPGVGLDPLDRELATQASLILALIVGLLLLLTCTNVANLFLSRATMRRPEVGVRMALGAGRGRLARQLVTESSILALGATLLAVPAVAAAGELLPLLFPYSLSTSLEADGRVYAFLVAIGVATGLLFGAAPAWSASRGDVTRALRDGASTGARPHTRLRDALVVSQLAISLGLVTGAALLGRSVLNARNATPGFEPRGLAAAFVSPRSTGRYDEEGTPVFFENLLTEAERQPGVRLTTLASQLPLAGGQSRGSVHPTGRPELSFEAEVTIVGPRYFETMGITMLRGRGLRGFGEEPERAVVVNEALAAMFWPGEDPIGKEVHDPSWRVVGLVPDVQQRSLRARGNPAVYYPVDHWLPASMALVMSSESGRAPGAETLRGTVAAVDPALPVTTVYDLHAAIVASMRETRTIGYLVSAFAVLALLLATVGLYGLVSFSASRRVREIGIRIALGAQPESLVRLILARGLAISFAGVALGIGISYGLGLALRSLLFGVTFTDVPTLATASLVLIAAAGIAAWLPARRASRADAVISLRE